MRVSEPFRFRQGQVFTIGNLTFTSLPPPLPVSIALTADQALIEVGQTTQLTTTGTLGDGSQQDVTPRTAWTTYRTSNPDIATVDDVTVPAPGVVVTGHSAGTVFITATNEGATAVAQITMTTQVVNTTVQGFVQFADGTPALGADVTTNAGGMAVPDSDGHFTIELSVPAEGTSLRITATLESGEDTYVGTSDSVLVVADGITDAGIVELCLSAAGFALSLDGSNDLVTFGPVASLNEHTFEAWVNPGTTGGGGFVVQNTGSGPACGAGIYLHHRPVSKQVCYVFDPSGCGTSGTSVCTDGPVLDEWIHVAGTYDGISQRLFVNGELVAVEANPSSFPSTSYLRAGTYYFFSGGQQYFSGLLDELRIWDHARSPEEIIATVHVPLTGSEPGLRSYWKFNEGSGQIVNDSSPGGDTGVLGTSSGAQSTDPLWVISGAPLCDGSR